MPVSWMPKRTTIEEDIIEEEARIAALQWQKQPKDRWQPQIGQPIAAPEQWAPEMPVTPSAQMPQVTREAPSFPMPTVGAPVPELPTIWQPEVTTKWWEKPKEITETVMEKFAAGITKVPVLREAFEFVSPAFEFIHEKMERPFSAFITAPRSPSLPYKSGESWIEHEKREYDAWASPAYIKGLAEFAMPLWWMPWFGWASKGARTLIGAGKAGKMAALLPKLPAEALLPTYTQLENFIPNNLFKRVALKLEEVPVLGRMIKITGGEAAFTRRNPITLADKVKNYSVFQGIHRDMGENLVRIHMNDLPMKRIIAREGKQLFKTEDDLLKLYDFEAIAGQKMNAKVGVVATDVAHPGVIDKAGKVSYYIDDVWQNPNLYKWTDKAAFEYVKQGHEVVDWFINWAKANGVVIPTTKRGLKVVGEMIQEHIPRIAKGATSPEGLFAPFKRTDPFMEMIHDLMAEGVEAGVKYGGTFAERVDLMSRAITRRVATRKFDDAVRPLGETLFQRLEALEPAIVGQFSKQANRVDVLRRALRSLQMGKPVHYATQGLLQEEFPQLAARIAGTITVSPQEMIKYIRGLSRTSQLIAEKNRKPLIEALLAMPDKTTFYDTIATVTKFSKTEQIAIRLAERLYRRQAIAQVKEFRELTKLTKGFLITETDALKPITADVAKLKRQLRIPKEERFEAKFRSHPAFNKRIFPADVVKTLEPLLTDRGNTWMRQMGQISGLSRMLVAALDLSAPFIQGLMVFGRNPLAWGKATFKMMQIAKTPWKLHLELAARKASRLERVLHGGSTASIDYFEALPFLRKGLGKIAGAKGERLVVETYGRAEAAFLGFGEIARDEMWKAGKFMIGKKGLAEAAQETQLRELANSLDKMTGVISPQALGIGLSQQQVESAWIFFAPRYTRAGLSFMGDIIRGGLTGAEARKALAGVALGGTTMYTGMCSALGQTPNFDPRSARFMTVKIGDSHIGVGGIYYAVLRTMADVAATAVEEPGQLSPLNFSRTDNPFYKFLYARTAPLTGLTFGLAIEQKNYFGEPFENPADYAAFMADKVLPIALQSVMPWERKPWQDKAFEPTRLGAEFVGMRTFPTSAWEARDTYRDNLAQSQGKSWAELTRAEQRNIEQDNPILEMFDKEIKEFNLRRGDPEDISFNRWMDEIDVSKEDRDIRIRNVAAEAIKTNDLYKFRMAIEDIENDYAAISQHINANEEYKGVMEALNQPKTAEQLSRMTTIDASYNIWASYRFSKTITPWGKMQNELGEPMWGNIEKFRQWFGEKFGNDALQYCEQDRPLAGRNLPPLYLELRKARQVLRPYWKVQDEVERIFGKPTTPWQEKRINNLIQKVRKQMRRTNPEMEAAYIKFYTR